MDIHLIHSEMFLIVCCLFSVQQGAMYCTYLSTKSCSFWQNRLNKSYIPGADLPLLFCGPREGSNSTSAIRHPRGPTTVAAIWHRPMAASFLDSFDHWTHRWPGSLYLLQSHLESVCIFHFWWYLSILTTAELFPYHWKRWNFCGYLLFF